MQPQNQNSTAIKNEQLIEIQPEKFEKGVQKLIQKFRVWKKIHGSTFYCIFCDRGELLYSFT